MKLTTSIRSAFVRAAMADVPTIDYDQQAHDLIQADFVQQMPPKIRAIYRDKELRGFLATQTVMTPGSMWSQGVYGNGFKVSAEVRTKLQELADLKVAQNNKLLKLKADLTAAANSATTRKRLVEMLPEFEKYLPASAQAADRTVPVIANLVSDFAKAGWPKGKGKAA